MKDSPLLKPWTEGTHGLRMTFSDMVNLAAFERCTYFSGTPILSSFSTMLIPVEQTEDGNTVQWHIEVNVGQVEFSRINPRNHTKMQGGSFEELSTKMVVLGWVDRALIALGTRSISIASIAVSSATITSHIQIHSNIVRKLEVQASLPAPFDLAKFTGGGTRQTECKQNG